jgi:hypothetical protein
MSAKSSGKTSAPLADSGATKLMRSVDLPSNKKEEILLRTDHWRATRIPDDVSQKLSQNPCAACGFEGHKADAIRRSSNQ